MNKTTYKGSHKILVFFCFGETFANVSALPQCLPSLFPPLPRKIEGGSGQGAKRGRGEEEREVAATLSPPSHLGCQLGRKEGGKDRPLAKGTKKKGGI